MPLPNRWNKKKKAPPAGFEIVQDTLEALEHELRDQIAKVDPKQRKQESTWVVHQINWQKSRYIYDLFFKYHRISKQVYQYCIHQKYVDAALMAKWKKPGYERLCSTYVINPTNYKFATTSLCRVPLWDRSAAQKDAQDPTTGCRGCASGKGAGPTNLFGNKYGQYLAAVQVAREERKQSSAKEENDSDGSSSSSEEESDEGPAPAPVASAGAGDSETEDEDDSEDDEGPSLPPPTKKVKT